MVRVKATFICLVLLGSFCVLETQEVMSGTPRYRYATRYATQACYREETHYETRECVRYRHELVPQTETRLVRRCRWVVKEFPVIEYAPQQEMQKVQVYDRVLNWRTEARSYLQTNYRQEVRQKTISSCQLACVAGNPCPVPVHYKKTVNQPVCVPYTEQVQVEVQVPYCETVERVVEVPCTRYVPVQRTVQRRVPEYYWEEEQYTVMVSRYVPETYAVQVPVQVQVPYQVQIPYTVCEAYCP